MATGAQKTLPARLESGRQRFEQWRSTHSGRRRIPEPMWQLASTLAVEFGVHRTATALRLNGAALKARVLVAPGDGDSKTSAPTFVECFAPAAAGGKGCWVEFEDGRGARMRMQFESTDSVLLGTLTTAFMRGWR